MRRVLALVALCPEFAVFVNAQTGRDYFNELKSTNSTTGVLDQHKAEYVCFPNKDELSFTIMAKAADVIARMRKAGDVAGAKKIEQSPYKNALFVQTYYKGVANEDLIFEPVGTDGASYSLEFKSPIHGKMVYSIK